VGLPNMRVQRTRSSPSALRSPLTRHPLGGSETRIVVIVVVTTLVLLGCVTVGGRARFDLASGWADVSCGSSANGSDSTAVLRAEAFDPLGQPLPGVDIEASGPSREGRAPIRWSTRPDEPLAQALAPGSWKVTASLGGFRSHSVSIVLNPGDSCSVHFYLRLKTETAVSVVASRAA
jgi:hypothetical protein